MVFMVKWLVTTVMVVILVVYNVKNARSPRQRSLIPGFLGPSQAVALVVTRVETSKIMRLGGLALGVTTTPGVIVSGVVNQEVSKGFIHKAY